MDASQAYLMIDVLKDVVKRGTGRNANVDGIEVAGKTGTTNKFRDGWWCGFTPDTTTIVWYGMFRK
jgi:penicillin-binding protein 1A